MRSMYHSYELGGLMGRDSWWDDDYGGVGVGLAESDGS